MQEPTDWAQGACPKRTRYDTTPRCEAETDGTLVTTQVLNLETPVAPEIGL